MLDADADADVMPVATRCAILDADAGDADA
jgi:hypothetical protein